MTIVAKRYRVPLDLGPFWEHNNELLERIAKTEFPLTSTYQFFYTDIYADYLDDIDRYFVDVFTVSITREKKIYMHLGALLMPKTLDIIEERITVGKGTNWEYGDEIILKGNEVKSKRHKVWLKELLKPKS